MSRLVIFVLPISCVFAGCVSGTSGTGLATSTERDPKENLPLPRVISSSSVSDTGPTESYARSPKIPAEQPHPNSSRYTVHLVDGRSQPADEVYFIAPYYNLTYKGEKFQIRKAKVRTVEWFHSTGNTGQTTVVQPARPPTQPKKQAETPTIEETPRSSEKSLSTRIFAEQYIEEVLANGEFIILDDESVWQVDSFDTFDTSLWLSQSEVIVKETIYEGNVLHDMINLDENESVWVTRLGSIELRSYIKGDFEGWEGDTIFPLSNGRVFQQVDSAYHYHYAYMPEVILIETLGRGGYTMIVDGVDEMVRVRAIR